MHSRTFLLLLASSLVACGGDDTNTLDGGPDATTDVTQNKDSATDGTTTTDGSNDATTTDSGGDAAPTDAGDGGITIGDGGTFACGTTTCNLNTQYCSKLTVGPDGGIPLDAGKVDGGNKEVDTCQGYPAQCTADGGTPSCACVQGTCGCTDTSGAIIVTCP
jgi:hypothetical protein